MCSGTRLLAAMLVGLGVSASARAQICGSKFYPPPGATSNANVAIHGRRYDPKPTAKKAAAAPKAGAAAAAPKKPDPKIGEQALDKARAEEWAKCLRRMEVCMQLQQVAVETNDDQLRQKAEELNQRVLSAYEHRIAEMSGTHTDSRLDEKILDRHLDAETSASRALLSSTSGNRTGADMKEDRNE